MEDELLKALIDGKHNTLIISVTGGFVVFFGYGRKFIVASVVRVRAWYANRAYCKRVLSGREEALSAWDDVLEGKVLEKLDENEVANKVELKRVEAKVDHTNELLESFLVENQAEMNSINKNLMDTQKKLRAAGL